MGNTIQHTCATSMVTMVNMMNIMMNTVQYFEGYCIWFVEGKPRSLAIGSIIPHRY